MSLSQTPESNELQYFRNFRVPHEAAPPEQTMWSLLSRTENTPHHIFCRAAGSHSFPSQFLGATEASQKENYKLYHEDFSPSSLLRKNS